MAKPVLLALLAVAVIAATPAMAGMKKARKHVNRWDQGAYVILFGVLATEDKDRDEDTEAEPRRQPRAMSFGTYYGRYHRCSGELSCSE